MPDAQLGKRTPAQRAGVKLYQVAQIDSYLTVGRVNREEVVQVDFGSVFFAIIAEVDQILDVDLQLIAGRVKAEEIAQL